jgi:hypothetical protein
VRNVLTTLDERAPSELHWQLTLLATLGGFLFGCDTSNRRSRNAYSEQREQRPAGSDARLGAGHSGA